MLAGRTVVVLGWVTASCMQCDNPGELAAAGTDAAAAAGVLTPGGRTQEQWPALGLSAVTVRPNRYRLIG